MNNHTEPAFPHESTSTITHRMNEAPTPVAPPLYQRLTLVLLGISLFVSILWLTQELVVPLIFALLLAILLDPLVKLLTRWGLPRVAGITIAVLVSMLALAAVGYFVVTQAAKFSESIPELKEKLNQTGEQITGWASNTAHVQPKELNEAVEKVKKEGMESGGMIVGKTLTTVGALFGFFFLLPVFTFLIIYYKELFQNFLSKLFARKDQDALEDVLGETKSVVQSFLVGRMVETAILTAMNWTALMLIGVKYALLLAVIGALMNLVPYLGMIVATVITVMVAFVFQDLNAALWVLGAYSLIQFIDNQFLTPLVVGARVQINALWSIVVVIAGGLLWGIPGMFLSIPLFGIMKVVFDRVPELEPWGYVLGTGEKSEKTPTKSLRRKKDQA